jgi:superfamily II DNA or RNA helicase
MRDDGKRAALRDFLGQVHKGGDSNTISQAGNRRLLETRPATRHDAGMSERPVITPELLRELGDWRTEKEGRALAATGAVQDWKWEPPFLTGTVRSTGGTTVHARLKLGARATEVENLCACRQARVEGTICAHVLALIYATQLPATQPVAPVRVAPPTGIQFVPLTEAGDQNSILELKILLPLNLDAALRAGELRVVMEGRVAGGEFRPFDALSKDVTYAVGEADERILAAGHQTGLWPLRVADLGLLLGHPRVWLGKRTPVQVREPTQPTRLALTLEPTGTLKLQLTGPATSQWTFDGQTLTSPSILPAGYAPGEHHLTRAEFIRFYQHELPGLQAKIAVECSPEFDRLEFVERPAPVRLTLDGGLTGLTLEVEAPAATEWRPDPDHPFRYWRYAAPNLTEIAAAGFVHGRLTSETRVGYFLANVLPRWERQWTIEYGPQFAKFLRQCDRIVPEVKITGGDNHWLAVDLHYAGALMPVDVQRMLQKGAAHHRQPNGRLALVPTEAVEEFQEVIFDCAAQAGKISPRFAPYLAEALRESPLRATWQAPREIRAAPPLELPDYLRAYQRDGVRWLHQLATHHLAGILADEMGLGKTVQTLVWLAAARQTPALIVCPTSLLANWHAEVGRFTPELKARVLHGANREVGEIAGQDLVITSYALLRRDLAQHQQLEWRAVILDEAQHIKNRFSQIAQAVKALRATHRFVLTGTPVENSLGDLWSIFDFLMPGYLGPAAEFRDRYEKPTDPATRARLRQRIRPFVLRRTKAEVARDLPAKMEQITWCELTGEQQAVYQSLLTQGRRQVFAETNEARRRLAVLTTLLRLRQACCHLGLLPDAATWNEPSAKLATCRELLDEAVRSGHRVLVFSQFVKLLKLVAAAVDGPFCYLDGRTVDRAGEIRRFQESDIPVFLISLKAGGTGLNLTVADTVIHLDPWWNPAVEEQATARAHRIGQRRVVNSYKLIARGSVEEKIVKLQERKRELFGQTIASDEAFVQGLTADELRELLQ